MVARGDDLDAHGHGRVERLARPPQRVDPRVEAQRNPRRRGSGVDDAGQLPRTIDDLGEGQPQIGRRRSGTRARKDLRRQYVVAPEAEIDAHDVDEAADEERRADEQHDGQRDLGDDERRTGATAAAARAAATGALGEGG